MGCHRHALTTSSVGSYEGSQLLVGGNRSRAGVVLHWWVGSAAVDDLAERGVDVDGRCVSLAGARDE